MARSAALALVACAGMQTEAGAISLGTASSFGLLGSTGVTNTGSSIVSNGNVGSAPTPAVSGFPPGIVDNGLLFLDADPVTAEAHADLVTAYNEARDTLGGVPGPDLGGETLEPGIYTYELAASWSAGTLTLDALGDPEAQWLFQIGTDLTTPADAIVDLVDGAAADNVIWQVGGSATLGANNDFAGSILALTSVTLGGGTLNGRALAVNGLVSISTVTNVNVPEPGEVPALGVALASLFSLRIAARVRRSEP